ncbi:MAG: sodium-dependent bicarbonate transport family permease [Ignavibacteria bacterium]
MIENLLDPVILFFVVGLLAGILKTDLKLPEPIYEVLSIYLLIAIGLKGGIQLSESHFKEIISPIIGTISIGVIIPIIAYIILRKIGKFDRVNSAAIAAHYGSVSAVTYAVVIAFLDKFKISYENYTTVLLVLLEIPAIAVGILIAKVKASKGPFSLSKLVKEVLFGRSIYLLVMGLLIGYVLGPEKTNSVKILFTDLFKGLLAFFLLEMGLVTSYRLKDLKRVGLFLVAFGIIMPLISAVIGSLVGLIVGLSVGGTTVLATLAASASYIAAPAAMRIAVPQANPTFYLTASLGITFPFNLIFGIPIYHWLATTLVGV